MKSFMGSFAETKINQVIDIVNLYKIIKESKEENINESYIKSFNNFFNKNKNAQNINQILEDTQLQKLKITIQSIGEPILKNKLLNDLKYLFGEVQDINKIVQELKGKDIKEIKEKLKNYSQSEQNEILKKLYLESTDD